MKRAIRITAVWLFTIMLGGYCSGATIIVDDDDPCADFSSIQEAINYSLDGDIIIVKPGTYDPGIHFNSRVLSRIPTAWARIWATAARRC